MNDLYAWIIGNSSLSSFNAALLVLVFFLARQRFNGFIADIETCKKHNRECELTLIKHGFSIEREE